MSGLDTARLLLAGVPTAREVEYHVWTATRPEYRGELRAAGEVLWFVYAGLEPAGPSLPTEPGAVVLAYEVRGMNLDRPQLLVRSERTGLWWSPTPLGDDERWHHDDEAIRRWSPAVVVPAGDDGPVAALREIRRVLDAHPGGSWATAMEQVGSLADDALRVLGGAS